MWSKSSTELRQTCEALNEMIDRLRSYYQIIREGDEMAAVKAKITQLEQRQEFCCALAGYKDRNDENH